MALDERLRGDLPTLRAKDVIMRHIIANLVSTHAGEMWEDYPEIGENDWVEIVTRLTDRYRFPPRERFDAAYKNLATRANGDGDLG